MKYIYRIINKIIEKLESIANHYIYTTLGKEALCVIRSILYTVQCTVHRRMKKDANIYIKYTSSKHTPRFFGRQRVRVERKIIYFGFYAEFFFDIYVLFSQKNLCSN